MVFSELVAHRDPKGLMAGLPPTEVLPMETKTHNWQEMFWLAVFSPGGIQTRVKAIEELEKRHLGCAVDTLLSSSPDPVYGIAEAFGTAGDFPQAKALLDFRQTNLRKVDTSDGQLIQFCKTGLGFVNDFILGLLWRAQANGIDLQPILASQQNAGEAKSLAQILNLARLQALGPATLGQLKLKLHMNYRNIYNIFTRNGLSFIKNHALTSEQQMQFVTCCWQNYGKAAELVPYLPLELALTWPYYHSFMSVKGFRQRYRIDHTALKRAIKKLPNQGRDCQFILIRRPKGTNSNMMVGAMSPEMVVALSTIIEQGRSARLEKKKQKETAPKITRKKTKVAARKKPRKVSMGDSEDREDDEDDKHDYDRYFRLEVDTFELYLKEVGQTPLLTREEEVALAKAREAEISARKRLAKLPARDKRRRELEAVCENGRQATERLIASNLRLVISIAKRYAGRGATLQDLVQLGNVALIKSVVPNFDWRKGFKFSTYATWAIRQAITRAVAINPEGQNRFSAQRVEALGILHKFKRDMEQELQCSLSNEALCALVNERGIILFDNSRPNQKKRHKRTQGRTQGDIARELLGNEASRSHVLLDYPQDGMESGGVDYKVERFMADPAPSPENLVDRKLLKEEVARVLSEINHPDAARLRRVLELRFGLIDGIVLTLEEVGKKLGITKERVRQLEEIALHILRHPRHKRRLKEYI